MSKTVTGLRDSCAHVIAFLESCSHEYFFKGTPFLYDVRGGSLKKLLSNGCCIIKCHLFMSIAFKLATAGWYCITKGKMFLFCFCFCQRAWFLSSKVTSERVVWIKFSGYGSQLQEDVFWSTFVTLSSNNVLEELVLSSVGASPLMKPLFTPDGQQVEKWVYWDVSVGLKGT